MKRLHLKHIIRSHQNHLGPSTGKQRATSCKALTANWTATCDRTGCAPLEMPSQSKYSLAKALSWRRAALTWKKGAYF